MTVNGQPTPTRAPRWIGLGVVAAAVIGVATYMGLDLGQTPEDTILDEVVAASEPEPNAPNVSEEEETTVEGQTEEAVTQDPVEKVTTPSFDEVRQEADGLTVIAGRAEPGSTVTVLVDGQETAEAVADARGSFAAVGFLDPSADGSVVTLRQGDGADVTLSEEEIILAPLPTPAAPEIETAIVSENTEIAAEETPGATEQTPTGQSLSPSAMVDVTQPESVVPSQPTLNRPTEVEEDVVPERQRVAVLKSTQGGVELLQAPPVIETVALDTIGYSSQGDVQLAGRAQPGSAEVRVYLNDRSVVQMEVDADGRWRGDVPDVAPGIYTLRIDEVDIEGRVSSRVETPFKREAIAVLEEASAKAEGPITAVTVQRGDTLWAIARDRYGEGPLFVRVFEANRNAIRDPDLIYPGQVFDLPD